MNQCYSSNSTLKLKFINIDNKTFSDPFPMQTARVPWLRRPRRLPLLVPLRRLPLPPRAQVPGRIRHGGARERWAAGELRAAHGQHPQEVLQGGDGGEARPRGQDQGGGHRGGGEGQGGGGGAGEEKHRIEDLK